MLLIKTAKATVEIEPGSHFFLKRGDASDDSVRIDWNDLDDTSVENLNQLVTIIEGSLDAFTQEQ
jgi:hypothetical protein